MNQLQVKEATIGIGDAEGIHPLYLGVVWIRRHGHIYGAIQS
jgi:hypothetical protein